MDRWSSTRVLDEVFRLYRGWSAGEAPRLRIEVPANATTAIAKPATAARSQVSIGEW